MQGYPAALNTLVRQLTRLPTIGERSAFRLAYHLLINDSSQALSLAQALTEAAEQVALCARCYHITDSELCSVCRDASRDAAQICVVEKPLDVFAIERVGEFKGYYHVLHGVWAPLKGRGVDALKIQELLERVGAGSAIQEVILALGATVEGDATSLYIARLLTEKGLKISRLAQGIPKGGELEYADEVTLSRAFTGRIAMG